MQKNIKKYIVDLDTYYEKYNMYISTNDSKCPLKKRSTFTDCVRDYHDQIRMAEIAFGACMACAGIYGLASGPAGAGVFLGSAAVCYLAYYATVSAAKDSYNNCLASI